MKFNSMPTTETQSDGSSLTMQFLSTKFGLLIFCLHSLKKFKKNTLLIGNNT